MNNSILSEYKIKSLLKTQNMGRKIIILENVDSTNDEGKRRLSFEPEGTVILSEIQTSGRGRLGRKWVSPGGKGIWMSIILKPRIPADKIPSLTSVAAASVYLALEQVLLQADDKVLIKWPNDILIRDKKIGGILTEMQVCGDEVQAVVLGIGLNVNLEKGDFPDELLTAASSIFLETGQILDREQLIADILRYLETLYYRFIIEGDLSETLTICRRQSAVIGKRVRLINNGNQSGKVREAEVLDLGLRGELIVQYEDGKVASVLSGEISLRTI